MDWPAYFPDLNPIEHPWDALGRRFAARLHHPENTQQLKQMLIDEWALLPQEMLHHLALSMRRRCEATIAYHTPGLALHTTVAGKCPCSPEDEQERAGTGKERLYPLHKSHTTQVTASKAHHGRLMSSGTPALYR
ncbi:transposable element Tcb2 transposase [Trichonephila clavipes]|nr:transposable element Tcb2 transposase [Trichonephila clavipes]